MKKLFIIPFAFLILLMFCPAQTGLGLENVCQYYTGNFYINTFENSVLNNTTTLKNGNGYIIKCDTKDSTKVLNSLNNQKITGTCFDFKGKKTDAQNILMQFNAKVVFEETLNNIYFCYAFSEKLKNYVDYKGAKINLQIALNDNIVRVGNPLILIGA